MLARAFVRRADAARGWLYLSAVACVLSPAIQVYTQGGWEARADDRAHSARDHLPLCKDGGVGEACGT